MLHPSMATTSLAAGIKADMGGRPSHRTALYCESHPAPKNRARRMSSSTTPFPGGPSASVGAEQALCNLGLVRTCSDPPPPPFRSMPAVVLRVVGG